MKILRNKVPEPGEMIQEVPEEEAGDNDVAKAQIQRSEALAVEQMKNQRQLARINSSRKANSAKAELQKMRQLVQAQRIQRVRDEIDSNNQIRVAKAIARSSSAKNTGLYKSKARVSPTKSMPT